MGVLFLHVFTLSSFLASHSSGRGGTGNLLSSPSPGIDVATQHEVHQTHSSGRGGVGNIREASKSRETSRTRDASRARDSSRSRDTSIPRTSIDTEGKSKDHSVTSDMWDRVMSKERKE